MDLEQEKFARSSLDFVRKEIHFENTIIVNRLTGCIVFQSIILASIVAMGKISPIACVNFLSLIGLITSILFFITIFCAYITMSQWLKKSIAIKIDIGDKNLIIERELKNIDYIDLSTINTKDISGVDNIHKLSTLFGLLVPIILTCFWIWMLCEHPFNS